MKPVVMLSTLALLGCFACQRGTAVTTAVAQPVATADTSASATPAVQVSSPSTASPTATAPILTAQTSACDVSQTRVPLAKLAEPSWYASTNLYFRPYDLSTDSDTIVFKNSRYHFTFCRSDRSWSIQSAVAGVEETGAWDDPGAYTETELAGQTYRAKVQLSSDRDEVVFELGRPDTDEPIIQTLYTQNQLQQAGFGYDLGFPIISRAVAHDGSLWWAVHFEQGEGWSGIATVVQYRPGSDRLQVLQPEALDSARIMDMVVTGSGDQRALWLATQYSGEGSPEIPAKGLAVYLPSTDEVIPYTVDNSPLVGAIPSSLEQVDDRLWVATANGVCEIPAQTPGQYDAWNCWRFTAEAELPTGGVPLYRSVLSEDPTTILSGATVEVLWASYTTDDELRTPDQSRFEVRYEQGFTTGLERGAEVWSDVVYCDGEPLCGFYWAGREWHWDGERFARSHDEVVINYIAGGPMGLGAELWAENVPDWQLMRGDFDLLTLDDAETRLRYYSGWVDAAELDPYVTVVPQSWSAAGQRNPLLDVMATLPEQSQ